MKEVDTVDESKPAAFSILSEEGRTMMRKLVKATASSCFNYNVDLRNLIEVHELGVKKNLGGKMVLFQADSQNNVGRYRKGGHANYDLFS